MTGRIKTVKVSKIWKTAEILKTTCRKNDNKMNKTVKHKNRGKWKSSVRPETTVKLKMTGKQNDCKTKTTIKPENEGEEKLPVVK